MTLNEIYFALLNGLNVYWKNTGYKVILSNHSLHTIFIHNDSMCRLQPEELQHCFIGESNNA